MHEQLYGKLYIASPLSHEKSTDRLAAAGPLCVHLRVAFYISSHLGYSFWTILDAQRPR